MSTTIADILLPGNRSYVDVLDSTGFVDTVLIQAKDSDILIQFGPTQPSRNSSDGYYLKQYESVSVADEDNIWVRTINHCDSKVHISGENMPIVGGGAGGAFSNIPPETQSHFVIPITDSTTFADPPTVSDISAWYDSNVGAGLVNDEDQAPGDLTSFNGQFVWQVGDAEEGTDRLTLIETPSKNYFVSTLPLPADSTLGDRVYLWEDGDYVYEEISPGINAWVKYGPVIN